MALPQAVTDGITAFKGAFDAALPVERAPPLQVAALVAQGHALITLLDAAVLSSGKPLDAPDPSGFAGRFGTALDALGTVSSDHTRLVEARGLIGRAVLNLAQVSR